MWRYLWWILALHAFAGAGAFALRACQQSRIVNAMHDERAMIMDCNLGKEGTYVGSYEELHGKMGRHFLYLKADPAFSTPEEAEAALEGLRATVTIKDQNHAVLAASELNRKNSSTWEHPDGAINCAWFIEPVDIGHYSLEVAVIKPAAELANRVQQLEGQYGPGVSDHYRILVPLGMAQILSYPGVVLLVVAIAKTITSWYSRRKRVEARFGVA
jgi:hypothetical protein